MTLKLSTGLRDAVLTTSSFKGALDGSVVKLFGGVVPTDANSSIGSATLLCTVSVDGLGTGVTFEALPVSGAMVKTSSETWQGTNVASGTVTFWRIEASADDGSASTTAVRAQGQFGGVSGVISDSALVISAVQSLDSFVLALPLYA